MTVKKLNELFIVLLFLIGCSFLIWLTDADRLLASFFYTPEKGWLGENVEFWRFIYKWAPLPAWSIAIFSLIIFLAGYKLKLIRIFRRQSLFLILFFILGPGLIVNVVLKDNLGRPRPREIVEFHGQYQFIQAWQRGDAGTNSSFPSGHAAIAFAIIGPWFIMRRRNQGDEYQYLLVVLGWGGVVGAARILQGGHFLSDVIWAGGLVFITGQILSIWIRPEFDEQFFTTPMRFDYKKILS